MTNLTLFAALLKNWKKENLKKFQCYHQKMDGLNVKQIPGVQMNDLPAVEEIATNNFFEWC